MPDATDFPCEVRADSSGRLATVPGKHRDASPPNNLPLQISSFVGREKELAEAGRLLEDTRKRKIREASLPSFTSSSALS